LAVDDHARPRLASVLAEHSPRPLSAAGLSQPSSAPTGREPRRATVGRPGPRLYALCTTAHLSPPGALGCGRSRPVVAPHRPAADCRRCRRVWMTCLDRMRFQRQQTRRLALGTDQEARPRTGRTALARLGRGAVVDRQGGRSGRGRATSPQVHQLPEPPIARKRATGQRPPRALRCCRRGRLVILAALCLSQPVPGGALLPEPWPRSPETAVDQRYASPPLLKAA
jgi:hypothetical protein